MKYKFNEDKILDEIHKYIDNTYEEHYAKGETGFQAMENIIDKGHGTGFCMGNIEKYFCRYGQKEGYNRKDLLKIIHYAMLQLFIHDKENLPQDITYSASSEPTAVSSSNVYVQMESGKIGQVVIEGGKEVVRFVGYGQLDKNGAIISETFRYSTEE